MRVKNWDDAGLCFSVHGPKQAVQVRSQTAGSFGLESGMGRVEVRRCLSSELRRRLLGPVEVPARQFLVVLAALVHEDVRGPLVFAQQLDKVADGRDDGVPGLVGVDAS